MRCCNAYPGERDAFSPEVEGLISPKENGAICALAMEVDKPSPGGHGLDPLPSSHSPDPRAHPHVVQLTHATANFAEV